MTRHPLRWSSGRGGATLPTVARALSDDDLAFWLTRCQELSLLAEAAVLAAEATRRGGEDWAAGPLWRQMT